MVKPAAQPRDAQNQRMTETKWENDRVTSLLFTSKKINSVKKKSLKKRSQRESFIKFFLKQNERRLKTAFLCLQHSFLSLFTHFNCAKVD